MNPEISVIMGVYNLSPRYKEAIKSILDQTFQILNLLFVMISQLIIPYKF